MICYLSKVCLCPFVWSCRVVCHKHRLRQRFSNYGSGPLWGLPKFKKRSPNFELRNFSFYFFIQAKNKGFNRVFLHLRGRKIFKDNFGGVQQKSLRTLGLRYGLEPMEQCQAKAELGIAHQKEINISFYTEPQVDTHPTYLKHILNLTNLFELRGICWLRGIPNFESFCSS